MSYRLQETAVRELEGRLQKSVQTWTLEQDGLLAQKEQQLQSLRRELEKLSRSGEHQLLAAEEAKQQALTLGKGQNNRR